MTSLIFLLIEFLDELVFGIAEAAKPLIRDDLLLTYTQIGLLAFIPGLVSSLIEPVLGILADVWKRRLLILGGGVFFALALLLTALSRNFWFLLLSFALFYPASGAFVSLSQATLMDSQPSRRNQNMARWTFAGSLGVVTGPLLLGGILLIGGSWRGLFFGMALLAFVLVLVARGVVKRSTAVQETGSQQPGMADFKNGIKTALEYFKKKEIVRWLILLEFSDLMLDVLLGFLALYFVDVAGFTFKQAALAVAVWSGVGLLGDYLLIPLLERVDGLRYLRLSVLIELILFPAFLLIPGAWLKLVCLALLGLFNSGWYAILKGELYSAMPGRSGTVMTLGNIAGLAGAFLPLGIGFAADRFGLGGAMWLLLFGPLVLLFGLPRRKSSGMSVQI